MRPIEPPPNTKVANSKFTNGARFRRAKTKFFDPGLPRFMPEFNLAKLAHTHFGVRFGPKPTENAAAPRQRRTAGIVLVGSCS